MSEQHEIKIDGTGWNLSVGIAAQTRYRHEISQVSRSRHCNTGYEVTIILQGSCLLDVEDSHYTLSQGQAVIIAPGRYHALCPAPGGFDHFIFRMSPPKNTQLRSMKEQIPDHRIFTCNPKVTQVCQDLFDVYASKGAYWQELYSTLLKQLVLLILQALHLDNGTNRSAPYKATSKRSSQIYEFINDHLSDNIGIDDLARKMKLSSRQAKRVLHDCTGIGFRELLLNARMDRSQYLLRTTSKSLAEIAGEVGYSSEASFYRAFHRHFQMTPGKYRTQHDR